MAWNNNNNNGSGNYNRNSNNYGNNNRNNNYNGGNSRGNYGGGNRQQGAKKSGAKHSTYFPESGPNKGVEQHIVNAWMVRDKTLFKITAVTTSKSKLSEKGYYGSVAVDIVNTKTGQKQFYWATMHKASGRVLISEMTLVINPKARNGGYCGTFLRRNN